MANSIQSYEILKRIGEGGMAKVLLARHPGLNRFVAIKVVSGNDKNKVKRFEREAEVSASLRQENLPAIYDYFIDEIKKEHCLVMEYVEGIDLNAILRKRKRLPPAIAAMIIREISKGLEHIHALNIIHRDIKPGNIRLAKGGRVVLMDFGIAKQEEMDAQTNLTSTGIIVGTPSYMSPEQALGDKLTVQSDIFSLGTMLYELLSGRKPFKAESNLTLISLIAQCRYDPLSQVDPTLPPFLCDLVDKAMAKDCKDRFKHAGELVKDLNIFLQKLTQSDVAGYLKKFYKVVNGRAKFDEHAFDSIPVYPGHDSEDPDATDTIEIYRRTKRSPFRFLRRKPVLILLLLITVGALAWYWYRMPPTYGVVNMRLKTGETNLLDDVEFTVNGESVDVNTESGGLVQLRYFRQGRNTVQVKFPMIFQINEYNFVLKNQDDTRTITVDLDKDLEVYHSERYKFRLVVDTKPPGALVYIDKNLDQPFGKTPTSNLWPNVKPGNHIITLQKYGYKSLQINRPFSLRSDFRLSVELQEDLQSGN